MAIQVDQQSSETKLHALIDSVHRAFTDPAAWPDFLRSLATVLGARAAVILSQGPVERTGIRIAYRLAEHAIEQWQLRHQRSDPWLSAISMPGPGKSIVYRGSDLIGRPDPEHVFSREFLAPNQLGPHIGAWICPNAPLASPYGLLLWRAPNEPDFDDADVQNLSLAVRSIASQERVSTANVLSRVSGLNNPGRAAFLLNQQGALLMTNQRGAELIDCNLVHHAARSLEFASPSAGAWLRGLLASAEHSPGILDRPVEQRDRFAGLGVVDLVFYPLDPIGAGPSLLAARYGLTVGESSVRSDGSLARIANRMYRWTGAELDTVKRLADGYSVPDIARERDCSIETVRSHLKNAKRKAGVNRQVELVRLMLTLQGSDRPG